MLAVNLRVLWASWCLSFMISKLTGDVVGSLNNDDAVKKKMKWDLQRWFFYWTVRIISKEGLKNVIWLHDIFVQIHRINE